VSAYKLIIPKLSLIDITVDPISNPASTVTVNPLELKVSSDIFSYTSGILQAPVECASITLPSTLIDQSLLNVPYSASILSVTITPSTASFYSWFSMSFKFSIDLLRNTVIRIGISSLIDIVQNQPIVECLTYTPEFYFSSCSVSTVDDVQTLFVKLLTPYKKNSELKLDIIGYSMFKLPSNFDPLAGSQVLDFTLSAFFGTSELARSTDPPFQFPTLFPLPTEALTGASISVTPLNEGEVADYTFELKFDFLSLDSSDIIWIRFPLDYDPNFSQQELYYSTSLKGAPKAQIRNREVKLTGHYTQVVTGQLSVIVSGITNPNKRLNLPTGDFLIGILGSMGQLKFLAETIPGVELSNAPLVMDLISLKATSREARTDHHMAFQLNSIENFKDSKKGGLIKIRYPSNYITDIFLSKCGTQEDFSLYSYCSIANNLLTVKSTNNEFSTLSGTPLNLKLDNVRAPEMPGLTQNFEIYNFDEQKSLVLSRNFPNLSDSYLQFNLNNLEIIINEFQPIELSVGSFSDPISIRATELIKQRISVMPMYFDSAFLFDRNPIVLEKNSAGSFFRLAVPQTMLLKRFYITFGKGGDTNPSYYSLVAKVPVQVVPVRKLRDIFVETTIYANLGGMSVPMKVNVNNAPYKDIILDLQVLGENASMVKLSTNQLKLDKNVQETWFFISNIDPMYPSEKLSIAFELGGTEKASFQISSQMIYIPVRPIDPEAPVILNLTLVTVTRSKAILQIISDRLTYIHCVTGFRVILQVDESSWIRHCLQQHGHRPYDCVVSTSVQPWLCLRQIINRSIDC
jgi:hypothetical protein